MEISQPDNEKRFSIFVLILMIIAIICVLASCSCEYHLDKINKKCGKQAFTDTLLVHDTLITKEVKKDTIFKYFQRDTVIIREGKLTMKYYYQSHDSTVYLKGECASDTIVRVVKVPYTKYEVVYSLWSKYKLLLIICGFGLLLLGLYKLIK